MGFFACLLRLQPLGTRRRLKRRICRAAGKLGNLWGPMGTVGLIYLSTEALFREIAGMMAAHGTSCAVGEAGCRNSNAGRVGSRR